MQHTVLTFISPIQPGKVNELSDLLREINDLIPDSPLLPLKGVSKLHFTSLVILPEDGPQPGDELQEVYGPLLVFENNFDGDLDAYLDELLPKVGEGLHDIYQHCTGYEPDALDGYSALRSYLERHVVRPNAFHVGNVGRSALRIDEEKKLVAETESFLDEFVKMKGTDRPPAEIRKSIQTFVESSMTIRDLGPRQTWWEAVLPRLNIALLLIVALIFWWVVIPAVLIGAILLRRKEESDRVQPDPPRHDHVQRLESRENRRRVVQNHMASVTRVKPGEFRRVTLWLVLLLANLVARISTKGELSGIPSIHFAHWSLIDGGRRLLFLSNFDGSWENYLDDFIDKASNGLTAIWSNTVGFPKTQWLIQGGSRDGTRFKAIARDKQVHTNVWYSAYPELTVAGIDRNSTIREDLRRPLEEAQVREWLWRF
jgi:hypothetical protein